VRLLRIRWDGFATTRHWLSGVALAAHFMLAPKDEGGSGYREQTLAALYEPPPILRLLEQSNVPASLPDLNRRASS
jgi:hypothetical protein